MLWILLAYTGGEERHTSPLPVGSCFAIDRGSTDTAARTLIPEDYAKYLRLFASRRELGSTD
jgi:hypothetical protein